MTKKAAREEYGKLTEKSLERVKKLLESEVETYSEYLGGEVYGFVVEDENGEELDAGWGFYGLDFVKQEARASAEGLQEKPSKK